MNEGNTLQQAVKSNIRARVKDALGANKNTIVAEKMKVDDNKFASKHRLRNFDLYRANKKDITYTTNLTNRDEFSYSLLIHKEPLDESTTDQMHNDNLTELNAFQGNNIEIE